MWRNVCTSCVVLFVAIATSGCSPAILNVKPVADGEVGEGVVYALPRADFHIDMQYTIKKCEPFPEIEMVPTVTTSLTSDMNQRYVVDYEDMKRFMKASAISLEMYENGTLKGFNGSATDRTEEVVTKIAGAAGKLALGMTTGTLKSKYVPQIQPNNKWVEACNKLKESEEVEAALKTASKNLGDLDDRPVSAS